MYRNRDDSPEGTVHRLRTGGATKPPATLPVNDTARRVMLQAAIGALVDTEPPLVDSDDLRLALLTERVGEVGAAYWRGHVDLEGELLKVCATALAWLEAVERGRAA